MIRFIVALLALKPQPYIEFSQTHFQEEAAGYLLGSESHPHVTLAQFYGTQEDYDSLSKELEEIKAYPQPQITGISFTYDSTDKDLCWIALCVSREAELVHLHEKVVRAVESRNLKVLTESGELYRPHLTLARTRLSKISCPLPVLPLSQFELVIGEADELGQFKKILKRYPERA